jgi:hypothetical protein
MAESPNLDQFLEALRSTASTTLHAGIVEITEYEGVPLAPPVRLKIDETSLERYIAETGESAQEAFSASTSQKKAAIQLLSVNLEEMVLTRKGGQQTLLLMPDGLEWDV